MRLKGLSAGNTVLCGVITTLGILICYTNILEGPLKFLQVIIHLVQDFVALYISSVLLLRKDLQDRIPSGSNHPPNSKRPQHYFHFIRTLSPENKTQVSQLAQGSKWGCLSDSEWNPLRGSCIGVPNIASYSIGARVTSVSGRYLDPWEKPCNIDSIKASKQIHDHWDSLLKEAIIIGEGNALNINGTILIHLPFPAVITGLTFHHPPKRLLPVAEFYRSTPKDFELYGWDEKERRPTFRFGTFVYNVNGLSAQSFLVNRFSQSAFEFVLLKILSNYGNPNYTALYRFELHGLTSPPSWIKNT